MRCASHGKASAIGVRKHPCAIPFAGNLSNPESRPAIANKNPASEAGGATEEFVMKG